MTKTDKTRSVVDLMAGLLCIASAGLNAWNMAGVGITGWRLTTVGVFALISLVLFARYFNAATDDSQHVTGCF